MKRFLSALVLMVFATTASAESGWKSKPIVCGDTASVYERLIDQYDLRVVFAAVANAQSENLETFQTATFMYMNLDTGRFLLIEANAAEGYACVVQFGQGLDFNITDEGIRAFLLDGTGF